MYTDWLLKMKENEAQTTLEQRVVELLNPKVQSLQRNPAQAA